MAKANQDKMIATAEVLLDKIVEATAHFRRPDNLHDLAEAFKLVVEASPTVGSETSRRVVVR